MRGKELERVPEAGMSNVEQRFGCGIRITTERLLDEDASFDEQRDAAHELHAQLCNFVGLDERDPVSVDLQDSILPAGKAISPLDAARCIKDFARTRAFLLGVDAAVARAREIFELRPVRVLYAGCGPFALLVLLLTHRWAPDEVRFRLLDYHRRSLDVARDTARALGVLDHVEGFVEADATVYECEPDSRPHVLVVEAMQRALEHEPQVAIVSNLGKQLERGGTMVPERIDLHLTLVDLARAFEGEGAHRPCRLA